MTSYLRFLSIAPFFVLTTLLLSAEEWVDYDGYDIPGYGRKIVLISGDQEYRSEETLPQLGRILAQHHGFHCRVLFTQKDTNPGVIDPEPATHIPGLEALETADVLILAVRFLNLPDKQMQMIDDYVRSGRPVLGLRTTNHGFQIPKGGKWSHYDWLYEAEDEVWNGGFGQMIFGGKFIDHHGWKMHNSTLGIPVPARRDHSILRGLDKFPIWGPSFVYGINTPLRHNCEVLVYGQVLDGMTMDSKPLGPKPYEHSPKSLAADAKGKNEPMMPIAWTSEYKLPGGRPGLAFHSTIGASQDFESEGVRKLLVNGVYWLVGIKPPEGGCNVDLVGAFEVTPFEFRRGNAWQERGLKVASFAHEILPKSIKTPAESYLDPAKGRKGKLFADHPVNRFRLYDFYSRQAEAMMALPKRPTLLPDFPTIDGGHFGHWGAYHKNSFDDQRHNSAATSSAIAAAFNPNGLRGPGKTPRVIAFRLGDRGEMACAFDAESLRMVQVWKGDFVRFEPHRWGLGTGMAPHGKTMLKQTGKPLDGEFLGYHQNGNRNVIEYRLGQTRVLEHPWSSGEVFIRRFQFPEGVKNQIVIPLPVRESNKHGYANDPQFSDARLSKGELVVASAEPGAVVQVISHWNAPPGTRGIGRFLTVPDPAKLLSSVGPDLWPQGIRTSGKVAVSKHGNYVQDEIPVPLLNPYGTTMLTAGISFFEDGRAAVTTMIGDVWIVSGLDDDLDEVIWKRFATGLNHALGVEVIDGKIIVLGRDRLTRLHDRNNDGCADFYENFSQAFEPSAGGHSFYVGMQKDRENNLYFTASTHTVKVSADGKVATKLNAGGQRNPNGVGASLDGVVLTSANEGDWNPASLIFEIKDETDFCGRGAKADGPAVVPPLAFVPRGIDNSTGSQIFIEDDRWGLPPGVVIGTSFGNGTIYGLLRDTHWSERTQGAVFPLPFDFASGTHRGRFAPHDGQLYLVGADGWGNYAIQDGHLSRVRYIGGDVQLPVAWHAYENGIEIELATKLDPDSVIEDNFFLQQWHYQYSEAYGCRELSLKNPDVAGHDEVAVTAVRLSPDGKRLLISIPEIQPVECLHVHARLNTESGEPFLLDTFHTLLHLDKPNPKLLPRLGRVANTLELDVKFVLNGRDLPWTRNRFPEGTSPKRFVIESLAGLKFDKTLLEAKAGEPLQIDFKNVDPLMPHNLVFAKPGTAMTVGQASNMLLTNGASAAAEAHYVPETEDVLFHTSILVHNRRQTLYVYAPEEPGDYPYICTFPGHWGVMRGILRVSGN